MTGSDRDDFTKANALLAQWVKEGRQPQSPLFEQAFAIWRPHLDLYAKIASESGLDRDDAFEHLTLLWWEITRKWKPAKGAFKTIFTAARANRLKTLWGKKANRRRRDDYALEMLLDNEQLEGSFADPHTPMPYDRLIEKETLEEVRERLRVEAKRLAGGRTETEKNCSRVFAAMLKLRGEVCTCRSASVDWKPINKLTGLSRRQVDNSLQSFKVLHRESAREMLRSARPAKSH